MIIAKRSENPSDGRHAAVDSMSHDREDERLLLQGVLFLLDIANIEEIRKNHE